MDWMNVVKAAPYVINVVKSVQALRGKDTPNEQKHAEAKSLLVNGTRAAETATAHDFYDEQRASDLLDRAVVLGKRIVNEEAEIEAIYAELKTLRKAPVALPDLTA